MNTSMDILGVKFEFRLSVFYLFGPSVKKFGPSVFYLFGRPDSAVWSSSVIFCQLRYIQSFDNPAIQFAHKKMRAKI